MNLETSLAEGRTGQLLNRLCSLAIESRTNIYRAFEWPDRLPEDGYWMSPDLLTIAGTQLESELNDAQKMALSRWESIHFYSLNVNGIRELLSEVLKRIHTPGFEPFSEFLHHFMGEENEHMWFFAQFCLRYGGKLYPEKKLAMSSIDREDVGHFLVFARIQIFEEIVDYYNMRMANDVSLHPLIRSINRLHHQDESRHIAFGREMVSLLHRDLKKRLDKEELSQLEAYLKRYMLMSLQSFYNPQVYRDAGLENGFALRTRLLADPARKQRHDDVLKRTLSSFIHNGIFESEVVSL